MKIGISACLLGQKVRYDGSDKYHPEIVKLLKGNDIISICPEVMSGFLVPHDPLEIRDNKVYSIKGEDVSNKIQKGSELCFQLIQDCDFLILKTKSPSCGHNYIYDGSFSSKLIDGDGIFTRMCLANKMIIFNETEIDKIKAFLDGNAVI